MVWGVAVLAYVAAVLGRSSLAATGVTAAERFDVSSGVLSLLAVVQLAVYAALQVPAGVLVDRVGPRRVIAGGAVLVAVGQVVLALAAPFWLAVVGRMLVGAGDAVTFVSVLRLIPAWFPARRVPVYNQLAGILGQLGQVISAIPLAALVVGTGWAPAYLAAGGTSVLVAVLVLVVVRDGPAGTSATRAGGRGRAGGGGARARGAAGVLVPPRRAVPGQRLRAALGLPVPHRRRGRRRAGPPAGCSRSTSARASSSARCSGCWPGGGRNAASG